MVKKKSVVTVEGHAYSWMSMGISNEGAREEVWERMSYVWDGDKGGRATFAMRLHIVSCKESVGSLMQTRHIRSVYESL